MTIERSIQREFGIYDVSKDKYYNLNYLNAFSGDDEFIDEPTPFTYEECQRFLVHKSDKENLQIINLYGPKYLIAFQLDYLRKKYQEKYNLEISKATYRQDNETLSSSKKQSEKLKNKQNLYNELNNWDILVNSKETQLQGKFGEIKEQKPNLENYNLSSEDFNASEKTNLKNKYDINI